MRGPLSYSKQLPPNIKKLTSCPYEDIRNYIENNRNYFPSPLLYKYLSSKTSDEFLLDYLLNSSFWLSSPKSFNDPFDMSAELILGNNLSSQRDMLNKLLKDTQPDIKWKARQKMLPKEMINRKKHLYNAKSGFKDSVEKFGVFCFSEKNLNLLMWGHYANNHKGIVLQFDIAYDLQTFLPAKKIEYSEKYPLLDWSSQKVNDFEAVFKRKHIGWSYEKEWRLLYLKSASTYLKFKPEALTGLIFGCRTDISFKKKLLNILKQRQSKGLPTLNIYCVIMHENKYELKMEKDNTLEWPS